MHLAQSQAFQHLALCETHVGVTANNKWAKLARQNKLRLLSNAARATGTRCRTESGKLRATEGGELFISQGHRQVHGLCSGRFTELYVEGEKQLDGFLPVVVHQQGYSIVIVVFYGRCSLGLRAESLARLARLGTLLQALQLPW
eukprot:9497738-Pyramimonas_sp.AAC.1